MKTRWNGPGFGWLPLGVGLLLSASCTETIVPDPGPDSAGEDSTTTGAVPETGDTTVIPGEEGSTSEETPDDLPGGVPSGCADPAAEQEWALGMLQTNCGACHNPGGSASSTFGYLDDFGRMITTRKIVPGSAEDSSLYTRIAAGEMPPSGVSVRPTDGEIDRLANFINTCFADNPGCDPEEKLGILDVLGEIEQDLTLSNIDDRPFIRYFVNSHLYNLGYCEDDLSTQREALVKLVNSLSSEVQLQELEPIDPNETIFRIDIRDIGWDVPVGVFADKWEALVAASPYSVEFVEDRAETIKDFAQTAIPFVLGNAFIDIASEAPLYYDLAGVPGTLGELEDLLALDIETNIAEEEVFRAGVLESIVATQNRVVERHEIPLAANLSMWITYDFVDDGLAEQNIFTSPLDFEEELVSVIFSLPNGLHGYFLGDGDGIRLDEAPDVIIADSTQDDRNVHAGVSCFRCHTQFQPITDEVRDFVINGLDFDIPTKDIVREIYPPADEFLEVLEDDQRFYDGALSSLDLPLLGADDKEQISDSFLRYQLGVDINVAAAELFLEPSTLRSQIGRLNPAVATLGEENGIIKRDVWTGFFAEAVCQLNLGITDDDDCL